MPLNGLERQVSTSANSDACPRAHTPRQVGAEADGYAAAKAAVGVEVMWGGCFVAVCFIIIQRGRDAKLQRERTAVSRYDFLCEALM